MMGHILLRKPTVKRQHVLLHTYASDITVRRMAICMFITAISLGVLAAAGQKPESTQVPIGTRHVYKTVAGRELAVYIDDPPGTVAPAVRPTLLYFHGGAWVRGQLNQFNCRVDYLSGRGIIGIQVEYRLGWPEAEDPIDPPIEDAKSAMRWVRSHALELHIDPTRIGAVGASAGGHLVAFLGLMTGKDDPADDLSVSAKPDLMMLFNPAIDLGPSSPFARQRGQEYKSVSPLYHLHSGLPPMIILHGVSDAVVPVSTISKFVSEARDNGNDCALVIYPGVGHGFFSRGENFYKTIKQMDKFLAAHRFLRGAPDYEEIQKLPATS
jgi:acetyl esterase